MTNKHELTSKAGVIAKLAVLFLLAATSIHAQNTRFFSPQFFPTTTYIDAEVLADFNGDGIQDVATCNGYDPAEANVLLGNGDGTFGEPQSYDLGGAGPVDIAALSVAVKLLRAMVRR